MTIDVASLIFEIDSTQAVTARKRLEDLENVGAKVDASARRIKTATEQAGIGLDRVAVGAQRATKAATEHANSQGAVERATRQAELAATRAADREAAAWAKVGAALDKRNAAYRGSQALAAMKEEAAAAGALEARIDRLMNSIDPTRAAQSRLNAEMQEASALYKAGAISASDYAKAVGILDVKMAEAARGQGVLNGSLGPMGKGAKLAAHEMANLGSQFADIGVSLASGQALWLVAIQQGAQIGGIYGNAAARGVTFASALEGIAAAAAPAMAVLGPLALVVGSIGLAFAVGAKEINDSNQDMINSLGLTEEQLKRVKNESVTMGDVMVGTWNAAAGALSKAFAPEIAAVRKAFNDWYDELIVNTVKEIKAIVGGFVGAYEVIKATWSGLPAAIGDVAVQATNAVIGAVEKMINGVLSAYNKLLPVIRGVMMASGNGAGAVGLREAGQITLGRVDNPNAGAAASTSAAAKEAWARGQAIASKMVDGAFAAIESETKKAWEKRVREEGGDAGKTPKGASAPRDMSDERTAQLEQMIAQATADELQARLGLAREVTERAALEHQIADQQQAVKAAQLARQRASIEDDNGLSDAKKIELLQQMDIVESINARAAIYRGQLIDERATADRAAEAFAIRSADIEAQVQVLESQKDLARSTAARRAIDMKILPLHQSLQREALKQVTESAVATKAQKDIAQALLDRLGVIHGNEREGLYRFEDAYRDAADAASDIATAFGRHDWDRLATGLVGAFDALKLAFSQAGNIAGKIGAVAGLANQVGQAIGGKAGNALSGAASGAMAGLTLTGGNPIGAAVGAAIGGIASLLSGGKAEKAKRNAEALKRAEEELARVRAVAAQKADLLITLMELQGDAAGALAARRKAELDGMDASNRALQERIYLEQDYQEKLAAAKSAVEDARSAVTAAYEAEAGAIQTTIDKFKTFADSLKKFRDQLYTGPQAMLSPEAQYQAAKSAFDRTSASALGGDEDAIRDLESVSQAYLDASKAYYASSKGYFDDLDRVRAAVTATQAYASHQVDIGQAQLAALNAQVSGIIEVKGAVLSVAAALAQYQQAIMALAQVQASKPANDNGGGATGATDWASYISKNADVAAEYARNMGSAKGRDYFAQLGIDSAMAFGKWHWENYGKAEGRTPYAAGGIMDRPITLGESGIGGEAGTEGILPLANVGGKMGVHATIPNDNSEVVAVLKELVAKQDQVIRELRADKVQRGKAAQETLKALGKVADASEEATRTAARKNAA